MSRFKIALAVAIIIGIAINIAFFVSGSNSPQQIPGFPVQTEDEVILSLDKEIRVTDEDQIFVAEQIQVQGQAKRFKKGLVRPLPVTMKNSQGGIITPSYTFMIATRDGKTLNMPEPKTVGNWILYSLVDGDSELPPGTFNYFFQYSASNILETLPNMKRLTHEVANLSANSVLSASATIRLPSMLKEENVTFKGYIETLAVQFDETGIISETDITKQFSFDDGSKDPGARGKPLILFSTKRKLEPLERFVIEITWAV
jgi:hypothetical protein